MFLFSCCFISIIKFLFNAIHSYSEMKKDLLPKSKNGDSRISHQRIHDDDGDDGDDGG